MSFWYTANARRTFILHSHGLEPARVMWGFASEQRVFDIGGVRVGGMPGERPAVLIGTIFYHRHRIVDDPETGEFDREAAQGLIAAQDEFSEKTGNPCMIDVVGASRGSMVRYMDFVAGATKAPILVDGVSLEIKFAGLEYANQSGLAERAVFNSLLPEYKGPDLERIRALGVKNAVLLAYNPKEMTTEGRMKTVRELLAMAREAGIEKVMVDTVVLDLPSLGPASRAIAEVKNELGLPAGSGCHNAIATWRGLKTKMGPQALKPCIASSVAVTVAVGADFVLYGPIEDAEYAFPAAAMVDVANSQLLMERKGRPKPGHPRYKVG